MSVLLGIFATYGLSFILTRTDGPMGYIYKLRQMKGLGALKCFNCTSVWVGCFVALFLSPHPIIFVIYALAFSGSVIFMERAMR